MRISSAVLTALVATGASAVALDHAANQQSPDVLAEIGTTSESASLSPARASDLPSAGAAKPAQEQAAPQATGAATAPDNNPTSSATPSPKPAITSATSDNIIYKYGSVQISLHKTNGKITKIDLVQADATNGRGEVYARLVDATIAAQGTNYGNISGATFTVQAFKQAVENALGKF